MPSSASANSGPYGCNHHHQSVTPRPHTTTNLSIIIPLHQLTPIIHTPIHAHLRPDTRLRVLRPISPRARREAVLVRGADVQDIVRVEAPLTPNDLGARLAERVHGVDGRLDGGEAVRKVRGGVVWVEEVVYLE